MAPPTGVALAYGTCKCGHEGPQKRPDICGRCVQNDSRAAKGRKPAKSRMIMGSCACGHEGWQLRPDICGKCVRDEAPRRRLRTNEQQKVAMAPSRRESIILKFKKLPQDYQISVLQELQDIV